MEEDILENRNDDEGVEKFHYLSRLCNRWNNHMVSNNSDRHLKTSAKDTSWPPF